VSDPVDRPELAEADSEHAGVRVWSVTGTSQQALVDRVAVVLGEHMGNDDELHVTYAVVQNGSQERARTRVLREPDRWIELTFEYSALIVLRPPTA
jgi:hypothetical protein